MVVLDTSVVYKWYAKEDDSSQATAIYDAHVQGKENIVVPDLIIYELANAWSTKTGLGVKKIRANLSNLQNTQLNIEQVKFGFIEKAITFAKKYKISVYDATYAVLAKQKKCTLITADNKFISQVKLPFIKNLKDFIYLK